MVQSGATQTTITTSWSPSTDNVGVTGYRLYKNGVLTATVAQTSYTFTGLTCGTTYIMGLTAVDAAGNESNVIFAQGPEKTSPCSTADTTAPTTPTALATSSISQTSITLSWAASTDNVGVAGYGRYLNGTLLSSATGTSYTYTGLACGHDGTVCPGQHGPERGDADDDHHVVEPVHRQRRRHRLPAVQERRARRDDCTDVVHVHRPYLRDDIQHRPDCRRRRRQRIECDLCPGTGVDEPVLHSRHNRAHDPNRARDQLDQPKQHHPQLGRLHRQRRRGRLRPLPQRHVAVERHGHELHLHRIELRDELHARR